VLTRIFADNYKSLQNFEFSPPQLAVLVGPNGSGKTSIGSVLMGLTRLLSEGLAADIAFPPETVCQWSGSVRQRFELEHTVKDGTYKYHLELKHVQKDRTVQIKLETLLFNQSLLYEFREGEVRLFGDNPSQQPRTSFPFDRARSFLPMLEERPDNKRIRTFKELVNATIVLRLNPIEMSGRSENEERRLAADGRNFAAWYRWFQQSEPEKLNAYFQTVREVFPTFRALKSEDAGSGVKELRAVFSISEKGPRLATEVKFALHALSEGQRQLLFLYLLLQTLDRPSFLFLDEPDNFISLREIQPWLSELESTLEASKSQALVVSHTTEAMDFLDSRQAFTVTRPDGAETHVSKLDGSDGTKASSWLRFGTPEVEGVSK
jgi:predicted ATPase